MSARILTTVATLIALTSLVVTPASAYWSVSTSATSVGRGSAATVNPGSTPTAIVSSKKNVKVTWTATKLSNNVAVTGYTVSRYDASDVLQTTLAGCAGTQTGLTCTELGVPDGRWTYRITPRMGANWVGAQGTASNQALTDVAPPVNNVTLVPTPNVYLSGTTVWVRTSAAAGSFQLSNALTDVTSGPASSASSLPTAGTGFSHVGSTVSLPAGGPYPSAAYSWTVGATGTPTARITGRDKLANTAATNIAVRPDNTVPTGGAISYPFGQQGSTTITVGVAAIADSGSGVAASSRLLQYASAPANGATCGVFGGWTDLLVDPPTSQGYVASPGCFQFRYVFTDSVGNQSITTQATNPTIIVRKYDDTVLNTTSIRSYWRLDGANSTIVDSGVNANNGTWFNAPTLSQSGAITAGGNTSVLFDGVNDYGRVTRQIQDDFSIEFWFKSTQGLGSGAWWAGAGLVDAEVATTINDFGVSLMADGRVVAGVGNPDTSLASAAGKNDGNWHHVVFTRTRTTGAIVLFVDGAQVASATGGTQSLNSSANIDFGRIQTGINYYKGNLDEIALYNAALPAATVLDHYNVGKLP